MTERVPDPSIDRIREHVRAQVARSSLRKVAVRAGIKVGATKKFIDGSVPYERNLRLWKKYYARELREGVAGKPDDALPPPDAEAVLELLLWGFPDEARGDAVSEAVELFRDLYVRHGRTPPSWVFALTGGDGANPVPARDPDREDPEALDDESDED
jgi:hypothetical protein